MPAFFKPRHLFLILVVALFGTFPRLWLGVSNEDALQFYYQQTATNNRSSASLDEILWKTLDLESRVLQQANNVTGLMTWGSNPVFSLSPLSPLSPSSSYWMKQLTENSQPEQQEQEDWCTTVQRARSNLMPSLRIQVPCEQLKPAKAAIVCMLTDGVPEGKENNKVFTTTNYIQGAMALGASLKDHIDPDTTHQLLLIRQGFIIDEEDVIRLESAGWTVGTAPRVPLQNRYVPSFPRYKTTYTKITAIGLAEYHCVMLMDADTLAVGDLRDILSCNLFTEPQHRVGGTLDWYRGRWLFFNTGVVLYRPDTTEMERVFNLTVDPTFMRKFGSDQDFLNNVYPERLNVTLNEMIMHGDVRFVPNGSVVDMTWAYNAQTHAEVQQPEWFERQRPTVRILHFTEKKGWHCARRHTPPPSLLDMPPECRSRQGKAIDICFCRNAHLYWDALIRAQRITNETISFRRQALQEAIANQPSLNTTFTKPRKLVV